MTNMPKMAAVALVLVLMVTVAVMAHMALSKTAPEADAVLSTSPDHIQVWFTQDPDPAISHVTLAGPNGGVELGKLMIIHDDKSIMAMVASTLPGGKYTVNWRSAGDDGHTRRGDFSFTVQTAN